MICFLATFGILANLVRKLGLTVQNAGFASGPILVVGGRICAVPNTVSYRNCVPLFSLIGPYFFEFWHRSGALLALAVGRVLRFCSQMGPQEVRRPNFHMHRLKVCTDSSTDKMPLRTPLPRRPHKTPEGSLWVGKVPPGREGHP